MIPRLHIAWPRAAVLLAAITLPGLTACVSVPESNFYTLDMRASGGVADTGRIEVARFNASDVLSKPAILIQATPTRIEYYAVDRWAADLAELIQEKLQSEFGPVSAPDFRIEGDILGFEQVDTGKNSADARVKLRVRVYGVGEREPLQRKTYEIQTPAEGEGPDAVVQALSRILEEIAVQISGDLATLQ